MDSRKFAITGDTKVPRLMYSVLEFILSLKEAYVLHALHSCVLQAQDNQINVFPAYHVQRVSGTILTILSDSHTPRWDHRWLTRSKSMRAISGATSCRASKSLLLDLVESASAMRCNPKR
jgi:hypothetical protein